MYPMYSLATHHLTPSAFLGEQWSKNGKKLKRFMNKSPDVFCISFQKLALCYIFIFFLDPNKYLVSYLASFSVKVQLIYMKVYSNSQSSTIQKFIFTEFR